MDKPILDGRGRSCNVNPDCPSHGDDYRPPWYACDLTGIADQCRKGHWFNVLIRLAEFQVKAVKALRDLINEEPPK